MFSVGEKVYTPCGQGTVVKNTGTWIKVEGIEHEWWEVTNKGWAPVYKKSGGTAKAGPAIAGGNCKRNHGPLNQLKTPKGVVYCRLCYRIDRAIREGKNLGVSSVATVPVDQVNLAVHNPIFEWKGWKAHFKNWEKELSQTHRLSIKNYCNSGYREVNKALRAGAEVSSAYSIVKPIDSALAAGVIPWDTILWRGGSRSFKTIAVGEVIEELGYASCSTDETFARSWHPEGVLLKIRVRAGQRGAYVEHLSDHKAEKEVILPRGSRFLVVERDENMHSRVQLTCDLM